ncbi:hypothetical protein STIAU_5720 [Stigmatella aurantiaca DW4/3-1]|uniref:Uncharacterized protein n=1 Tax=Stigmatella aurantiaca (strain DW4/3-1) TaxID=378806 RepID=Q08ZC5_STIAD|nr:hypothetical protein STIAU_5720 [Stigmatella aurantiaca DW4/3-1]
MDWDNEAGRAWVDFNVDGLADYCRHVGGAPSRCGACTASTGTGFGNPTQAALPIVEDGIKVESRDPSVKGGVVIHTERAWGMIRPPTRSSPPRRRRAIRARRPWIRGGLFGRLLPRGREAHVLRAHLSRGRPPGPPWGALPTARPWFAPCLTRS